MSVGRVVIALLFLTLCGGGVWLWRYVEEAERRTADLTEKVARSSQDARTAAEQSTQASAMAREAASRADTAEAARLNAEAARASAVDEKTKAESVATEAGNRAAAARSEIERMRKEREEELNHLQGVLNRIVETRRTSSGLVMNLSDKALHFEFDKADLSPQSRELLSRVTGILLAVGGYGLAIHGHTDDVGTPDYNQGLSERRAESVKQYLAGAGLDPGIITVKGFGKSSPLVSGHDEPARAKNRRVEIVLTDIKIKYLGEAP